MTVLIEKIVPDIADQNVFLSELRTFCQERGWTVDEFQQNVIWADTGGGVFGFVAGNESYLEVSSNGNGNQALRYRFRAYPDGGDSQAAWIKRGAFKTGESGKDTTSGNHPVRRVSGGAVAWDLDRDYTFNPNGIMRAMFYGDNRFIFAVVQYDTSYCSFMCFGSPDLLSASETELNFSGNDADFGPTKWYTRNNRLPFDTKDFCILRNGISDNSTFDYDIRLDSAGGLQGQFTRYGNIFLSDNAYSSIRPLSKIRIFEKKVTTRWGTVGEFPIFRFNTKNLAIGELVKYGTQHYRVFPDGRHNERDHGVAVRIQ